MTNETTLDASLSNLTTELVNPLTSSISSPTLSTGELLRLINDEDQKVAAAVRDERCMEVLAKVVDIVAERVRRGGRVIYFGAGTSGRLGVLDASECLPTYNCDQFVGIMAGGDSALRRAKEGVEDSQEAGAQDLSSLDPPLDPELDTAIGIASSGRTPYVIGGLKYARRMGCVTVGVVCVRGSEMDGVEMDLVGDEVDEGSETGAREEGRRRKVVEHIICAEVGPEVVTGSTRMKAGTATKLILNMLSTGVMIKVGKTYGNLMVDLKASNAKLRARAHRLIRTISRNPDLEPSYLDELLRQCGGSVKLAVVVQHMGGVLGQAEGGNGLTEHGDGVVERAGKLLSDADGRLEAVIGMPNLAVEIPNGTTWGERENQTERKVVDEEKSRKRLFLCIDGGGTSTRAVITSFSKVESTESSRESEKAVIIGRGHAGPCNLSTVGIEKAYEEIRKALEMALQDAGISLRGQGSSINLRLGGSTDIPGFEAAWIGCAGVDPITRPDSAQEFTSTMERIFGSTVASGRLRVSSDVALLGALLGSTSPTTSLPPVAESKSSPGHNISEQDQSQSDSYGVALVSGTGSIAMCFSREGRAISRAGGLGYLLGDEGGGFGIGREAIRRALKGGMVGNGGARKEWRAVVSNYFGTEGTDEQSMMKIIDKIYRAGEKNGETAKERIAGLAQVVLNKAFPPYADSQDSKPPPTPDLDALEVAQEGARSLALLVHEVLWTNSPYADQEAFEQWRNRSTTVRLVCTGGLMRCEGFREVVRKEVEVLLQNAPSPVKRMRTVDLTFFVEPSEEVGLAVPQMAISLNNT